MADRSIAERILDVHGDLARGERRLADLLLENPGNLARHSASKLAERAGVSKATAARLFKRLGYAGYREAQLLARRQDGEANADGAGELPDERPALPDLDLHLSSDLHNLTRSVEALRSDDIRRSISALARAEKIWVVGFGDNYPLAHFARALLIRIKPDIRMIPLGGFPVPEEFASITPNDTMLALGVRRRTMALLHIMRSAKKAGAQIVYVTDHTASSTTELATVTLRCRTRGAGLFDSVVAPVSVMTYICSALAASIGETAIGRLHRIESIHDEWGDLAGA